MTMVISDWCMMAGARPGSASRTNHQSPITRTTNHQRTMIYDLSNFLHSYCRYAVVAAAAQTPALALVYRTADGSVRNLWRNEAIEDAPGATSPLCGDPRCVAMIYRGGRDRLNPRPEVSIQLMTVGTSNDAAMAFAQGVFEAFALDAAGRELRMAAITGYTVADASDSTYTLISAVVQSSPGLIGRDDRGRARVVGNIDVGFRR